MRDTLLNFIEDEGRRIMVQTRVAGMLFIKLPHTSICYTQGDPSEIAQTGILLSYNTTEQAVLAQWHQVVVATIQEGVISRIRGKKENGDGDGLAQLRRWIDNYAGLPLDAFPLSEENLHMVRYLKNIR